MKKAKNINQIKKVLTENYPEIRDEFKVKELGIFGSYVWGKQKNKSDVDILVEFKEEPSLLKFISLEMLLSKIIGIRADLVMKSVLKPGIGRQILSEVIYL